MGGTGPPLQEGVWDIDIIFYIYRSCLLIWATPGRPYKAIRRRVVCRGWPVQPVCNSEFVYIGNRGIGIIPCIYRFCL